MAFMIWWKARRYIWISFYFNTSIIKILLFQFLLRDLSWVNLISIRSVILIIEISYEVTRVKIIHDTRSTVPPMRETRVQSLGQGSSPAEGNGSPLQYSCLENPMDGGAGRLQSTGSQRVGHDSDFTFFLSRSIVAHISEVLPVMSRALGNFKDHHKITDIFSAWKCCAQSIPSVGATQILLQKDKQLD